MTKVQVDSNGKVITLGGKALVASEGGSATLITKNITQNGTYNASSDNADGYSSVTVNVAGTTPTGTLSITANGVYDVTNYASANVSVPGGGTSSSEDYVCFIAYSSNSLAIQFSTINGVYYPDSTFSIDDHHFLVAVVPKNVSFSYIISGNNWTNGSGTITLTDNYILPLVKGSGNPSID